MIQLSKDSVQKLAHCRYECKEDCSKCSNPPSKSELYILNNAAEALQQVREYQEQKIFKEMGELGIN